MLTLDQYLERRLTRAMIKAAQKMGAQHRTLLRKVSAKYGVPPGVIVAVWGLESNYGRFSGVRPTIAPCSCACRQFSSRTGPRGPGKRVQSPAAKIAGSLVRP